MKKLAVLFVLAAMVMMYVTPASALENVFKGYWRTRAFSEQNFDGNKDTVGTKATEQNDVTEVDTRTRLFYTAIINDNLKFVNAFEIDTVWGSANTQIGVPAGETIGQTWGHSGAGYNADGDMGGDGVGIEVKHTYADFNLNLGGNNLLFGKVGLQPITIARGFVYSDDFAAAVLGFKNDMVNIPLIWIKGYEGGLGYNKMDMDIYGIAPTIKATDTISFTPYFFYCYSDHLYAWNPIIYNGTVNVFTASNLDGKGLTGLSKLSMYYAGLDVDAKFDPVSIWLTGIYQGGKVDTVTRTATTAAWNETNSDITIKAWLAALGAKVNINIFDVHGQVFYASGQDPEDNSNDFKAFFAPSPNFGTGQSYYWAEIMGRGTFDNLTTGTVMAVSKNSPGDHISNILAANLGVTVKPMPVLTISLDAWYAKLAEKRVISNDLGYVGKAGEKDDYLGTELDLKITYELVKNLNLDLVGAYLFQGDATYAGANDANPYEIGTQLSLSF